MSAIAVTTRPQTPLWRRLIGFNVLTGILLGIGGWYLGYFLGGKISGESLNYFSAEAGQNDIAIFSGYFLGVVGFLVGLGFANYPIKRMPATRRRWPRRRAPRSMGCCATSASAPTTRSWACSTWLASASGSSWAA
jgi:hypothetical protein